VVYVQGVPNNHKAGDVIMAVIADNRGTLFYVVPKEPEVEGK
jgi:hypothetical protein